jgi:hypothetical protein
MLERIKGTTYSKYKESTHMSLAIHLISQPSLDVFPIWTPIIEMEIRRLQLHAVSIIWKSYFFMLELYKCPI